jgi:hypothetical protein
MWIESNSKLSERRLISYALLLLVVVELVVGTIYVTGIGQNHRWLGVALLVSGVGFTYCIWRVGLLPWKQERGASPEKR